MKILFISFPTGFYNVTNIFLNDILKILEPCCEKLIIISNKFPIDDKSSTKVIITPLKIRLHKKGEIVPEIISKLWQIIKIVLIQFEISLNILKIRREFNIVFFYLGGGDLIIPVIISKLLRKRIVFFVIGSFSSNLERQSNSTSQYFMQKFYFFLEHFCYRLADQLVVESDYMKKFHVLSRYEDKISTLGARFVDTEKFRIIKPYAQRGNIVGYLGRLSEEKGVINFISAISLILEKRTDISFVVAGEGHLKKDIVDIIKTKNLAGKVTLINWVDHSEVPNFLNQLRLLIIPSYSEGLPTVLLEAMACGTPVLATQVGGIPDLVEDRVTGFFLNNNSPQEIANKIVSVLSYSQIEGIIINGRFKIENGYIYEHAVKRYKKIIIDSY